MPKTFAKYVPTLDEIAAGCLATRDGWPPAEHESRLTAAVDAQVWLLAAILRPMAIKAGYVSSMDADSKETGNSVNVYTVQAPAA